MNYKLKNRKAAQNNILKYILCLHQNDTLTLTMSVFRDLKTQKTKCKWIVVKLLRNEIFMSHEDFHSGENLDCGLYKNCRRSIVPIFP
jgi:hypothetical protein